MSEVQKIWAMGMESSDVYFFLVTHILSRRPLTIKKRFLSVLMSTVVMKNQSLATIDLKHIFPRLFDSGTTIDVLLAFLKTIHAVNPNGFIMDQQITLFETYKTRIRTYLIQRYPLCGM